MSVKRLNEKSVSKAKRQNGDNRINAAQKNAFIKTPYFFIPRSMEETVKRLSAKSMLCFRDFICMVEKCPV